MKQEAFDLESLSSFTPLVPIVTLGWIVLNALQYNALLLWGSFGKRFCGLICRRVHSYAAKQNVEADSTIEALLKFLVGVHKSPELDKVLIFIGLYLLCLML